MIKFSQVIFLFILGYARVRVDIKYLATNEVGHFLVLSNWVFEFCSSFVYFEFNYAYTCKEVEDRMENIVEILTV